MDLLDELDDELSSTQLIQNQLHYTNQDSAEEEEEEQEEQEEQEEDHVHLDTSKQPDQANALGFSFDIGSIAKSLSKDSDFSLSVLNGIKKRLGGDDHQSVQLHQPTSDKANDDTAFDFNFDNSMLNDADADADADADDDSAHEEEHDDDDGPSSAQQVHEIQKLPQLQIDESEFAITQPVDTSSTQIIQNDSNSSNSLPDTQPIAESHTDLNSLFVSQEDQESDKENNYKPLTKQERQAKIEHLAQLKRQQRLEKEKAQQQLQDELNTTTLTDEENDLNNEINDSVVSNANIHDHVSSKELKQAEEFLNIQKRNKDIRPEFEKKIVFTKQKLLSAFSDDDDDDNAVEEDKNEDHHHQKESSPLGLEANLRSTPHTSPVQAMAHKPLSLSSDEEDDVHGDLDVLALINKKPPVPPPTQSRNPIELYAQNLKRQLLLLSSPTKSDSDQQQEAGANHLLNQRLINLDDSDSDSNITSSSPIKNSTNLVQNLHVTNSDFTIPELSKDEKITIKQRFVKKKLLNSKLPQNLVIKNLGHKSNLKDSKDFLLNLQRANILQLKANKAHNGDNVVLEEMEKDDEVMGSLLEQEMERVRRIRVREKLREKAKLALLGKLNKNKDSDDNEAVPESDVPESEVPDSDYGSEVESGEDSGEESGSEIENGELIDYEAEEGSNDEDEDEDNQPETVSYRKSKRVILSEDDENESEKENIAESRHNDDSYMFGGHQDHGRDHDHQLEEAITTASSQSFQKHNPPITVLENSQSTLKLKRSQRSEDEQDNEFADFDEQGDDEHDDSRFNDDSYVLFQNLKPRTIDQSQQQSTQISDDLTNQSFTEYPMTLPSFREISEPNTQNESIVATQIDTVIDTTMTQVDSETQVIRAGSDIYDDDEEEDLITPSKVKTGRKLIRKNTSILNDIQEDDISEDNDDPEEEIEEQEEQEAMKLKIKMYEEKIRKQELKQRKKRKELERRGIKNMVEGEAEESEDEWKGLGGMDGELSDQANSDDERMIDNDFNIDLKDEEIRNKFMEDYQIKDQKELEKLLDDIKNHRLTKKVAGNGLDLELSDEEDQLLAAYRKQRLQEQRERLAESKKMQAYAKNEKAKAFFMEEEPTIIKLYEDDEGDEEEMEEEDSSGRRSKSKSKSPFNTDKSAGEGEDDDDDEEEDDIIEKEPPVKKTIKIEEAFVQRQLSFLNKSKDYEYENIQLISNKQHGINSSDDEIVDVKELKSKSLSNLTSKRSESPTTIIEEGAGVELESRKRSIDEVHDTDVDDDDIADDSLMPSFKKPSIISSFKSFHEQQGVSIKNGRKHFSGVTISKQYKVASGSKASITYMSKKSGGSTKQMKSLKEKRIQRSINSSKTEVKKIFSNEGFE